MFTGWCRVRRRTLRSADRKWILIAIILGTALAFMDGSVVNVALPTLQSTFHATSAAIQWVVQSYALFGAALAVAWGRNRGPLRTPPYISNGRVAVCCRLGGMCCLVFSASTDHRPRDPGGRSRIADPQGSPSFRRLSRNRNGAAPLAPGRPGPLSLPRLAP